MGLDFYVAIGSLVIAILLGLRLAYHNLNNAEAREYRLKLRQAYRKERKRLRDLKKP